MATAAIPRELDLDQIRSSLIRQEETIIFALIERAQFRRNTAVYEADAPAFRGVLSPSARTFLDHMLLEHERLHAAVRRYTAPDEHAFFPSKLPAPALAQLPQACVLRPNAINVNDQIKALYTERILPLVCADGDDQQYGSTTVCDVSVLQAISKRVHYGKFVAESKFLAQTAEYVRLIRMQDTAAIMALLTNVAVEEKLLRRVHAKASAYGQDIEDPASVTGTAGAGMEVAARGQAIQPCSSAVNGSDGGNGRLKVDPDMIVRLYRDWIIPLTKEVEVAYLLQRLGGAQLAHAPGLGQRAAARYVASLSSQPETGFAFVPCASVAAACSLVASGKASHAAVPLTTVAGALDVTSFHRLSNSGLCAAAEVLLPDELLVLAAPTQLPLTACRKVIGRLADLAVHEDWLRTVAPDAELAQLPASLTMREALEVSGPHVAVLCPAESATAAGLVPVPCDLPSSPQPTARYLVVSTQPQALATGRDRTIIFFKTKHARAGALSSVLDVFTAHGVNLENIHPYADPDGGAQACFYAECEGHSSDAQVAGALEGLVSRTSAVKCIGSFVSSAAALVPAIDASKRKQ